MINLYYWLYSLFPKPVPWLVTATEDTLYPFFSLWRPFKHRENNDKYQFHNISYHCIISRVVFSQKIFADFWKYHSNFQKFKPAKSLSNEHQQFRNTRTRYPAEKKVRILKNLDGDFQINFQLLDDHDWSWLIMIVCTGWLIIN